MKPRTYLQTRILEHLTILQSMVGIETLPDLSTARTWTSLHRLVDLYLELGCSPPAASTMPGLSAPKRKTHQPPPKKDVDPAGPGA